MVIVDTIDRLLPICYTVIVSVVKKLIYKGKMYKNVLLTENEIRVLSRVIDQHFNHSFIDTNSNDMKNLHIIQRSLIGLIPTDCTNGYSNEG